MISIITLTSLVFYFATFSISEQKATFLTVYQCKQVQVDSQVCVLKANKTVGLFENEN